MNCVDHVTTIHLFIEYLYIFLSSIEYLYELKDLVQWLYLIIKLSDIK